MHEFDLIQKYFNWDNPPSNVAIAVGDDAAVLNVPANKQLVTSIDTFVSGVHFPVTTKPHAIGHKALAVNLSDLAAMGATPSWFTLALTLPEIDKEWLSDFSDGMKTLAQKHHCFLVGGDTTRGPLSISIQVMGLIEKDKAVLRSGAKEGDLIYVTGTLGDASVALQSLLNGFELSTNESLFCENRLNYPTPRLDQSNIIKDFASSCIDVSDGLLQDLFHILEASDVGAELDLSLLPFSSSLKGLNRKKLLNFALTGGDDYELLFTIPPQKKQDFLNETKGKVCCIGKINHHLQQVFDEKGQKLTVSGYNHFHDK